MKTTKRLLIASIVLCFCTYSCGIFRKSGEKLDCDSSKKMTTKELSPTALSIFKSDEYVSMNNDDSYKSDFVYIVEGDSVFKTPLILVVRNKHGMGAPNKNETSKRKGGYHFEYENKWYFIRCGNLPFPLVLEDGNLFVPESHGIYYLLNRPPYIGDLKSFRLSNL